MATQYFASEIQIFLSSLNQEFSTVTLCLETWTSSNFSSIFLLENKGFQTYHMAGYENSLTIPSELIQGKY